MSSSPEERQGTLPTRSAVQYNDTTVYSGDEPLSKAERNKLHRLSFKNEHIDLLTPAEARQRIASGKHRPGSAKAIEQNAAETGMRPPAGIDNFTDEEIEARNAKRPQDSGLQVTRDEFTNKTLKAYREEGGNVVMDEYSGKVIAGSDPLNAKLLEMQKQFPDRRFRWEHPNSPPRSGPTWDPVYDAAGKQIQNGELFLVWMPEAVYDAGVRQPTLDRSKKLTNALNNRSDQMRDVESPGAAVNEGQLELEKSEVDYAAV